MHAPVIKRRLLAAALAFVLGVCLVAVATVTPAAAQDAPGDDPNDEGSAFANPAQAQKAESLAAASALEANPAEADALNQALADLDAAEASGDPAAIEAARDNLDGVIADMGGVTTAEIAEMRESGLGWGEIAHELGIHPSVLGLGQAQAARNRSQHSRMAGFSAPAVDDEGFATARNLRTGWAKGHGVAGQEGPGSSAGKGLGKDDAPGQSKDKGDKGDKGEGGGKGGGKGGGSGKK